MWGSVAGQPLALSYLQGLMQGRVKTALLLHGDEGIGKRLAVETAFRWYLCKGSKEADCRCQSCKLILKDLHPDVTLLTGNEHGELGIGPVRDLIDKVSVAPMQGAHLVLIDGADYMTTAAANALLKTLEEPPSTVKFCLTSTSLSATLSTIRSRVSILACSPLPLAFVQEKVTAFEQDADKVSVIARMAEGSPGRARRIWSEGQIRHRDLVLDALTFAVQRDFSAAFTMVDELGENLRGSLRWLTQILVDLLAPSPIVHADATSRLASLKGYPHWARVAERVRSMQVRDQETHLNLPFHVKTLLASL